MKKILLMDAKNYDTSFSEIYRVAVRGIIFISDKLLLIRSKYGEVKFPGGGQENGETDYDTLKREILEETGYHVNEDSIREFGEVEEKRLSMNEPMIWHQINRYYFCNVEEKKEECRYTENEKEYGFHQVMYSLDEAIQINQDMLCKEGVLAWNQREFNVLKLLKEFIHE
jgi:8-oxo-dGTP pyrophosphatase MutT (NUDIX family)